MNRGVYPHIPIGWLNDTVFRLVLNSGILEPDREVLYPTPDRARICGDTETCMVLGINRDVIAWKPSLSDSCNNTDCGGSIRSSTESESLSREAEREPD